MTRRFHFGIHPSTLIVVLAAIAHVAMLTSLLSEPFFLTYPINLTGTRTHPAELDSLKGFLDPWFHDTDRVPRGLDFFSIYQAGRNFMRGQSVYYGVRNHNLGETALVVPYFSGFRYLPIYACTFGVLLNILSPWHSYWTWIACVELLLIANLFILSRLMIPKHLRPMLIAMWLAYTPYYIELHIGQQSMVTVTLLHAIVAAASHFNTRLRDTCYIGSVIWKINTILFVPIWIKLKRNHTIIILFLTIIGLSAPYFFRHPGSFQEFSSYFGHRFIAVGPNSLGFWALGATTLQRFGLDHASIRTSLTLWSLIIIAIATCATLLPRRIHLPQALAMWICVYFLTYQYVWEHHFVMLLPVWSIGFIDPKLRRLTGAAWLVCALPTPYYFWNNPATMPQMQWTTVQDIGYHALKIVPILLLFIILIVHSFRYGNAIDPDSPDANQWDVTGMIRKWMGIHES
ncbi:hypothetical protein JXA80_11180 [bacterium]|nr:hypothetical protein [candidate division CSSED10-310 bacterium]